jgi:predicted Fe-Mo cluster-binding NifX family protein
MYITASNEPSGGKMKIAVATIDGVSLSQHFGQSKGFVVFDVEDSKVQSREFRTPGDTPHNQGICHHEAGDTQGAQDSVSIFDLLNDCGILLCGGMGAGAANALQANGIKPVMIPGVRSADDAVADYLSGNVPAAQAGFCNCKH